MAKEPSPAFQFYPREFEGDENVKAMSLEEVGAYVRLLCTCWTEHSIPDDLDRLARMLKVTRRKMERMWPQLEPCFRSDGGGRLTHPRLDRERKKQAAYRKRQSQAGKDGAAKRWEKDS